MVQSIESFHIELSSHRASGAGNLKLGKRANSSSGPFITSPKPSSTSSRSPNFLSITSGLSPVLPSSKFATNCKSPLFVLQLAYREFPCPLPGLLWIRAPPKLLPWGLPLPWLLKSVVVVFVVAVPLRFSVNLNPSDSRLALLGDCAVAEEPSKSRPLSDDSELSGRWWPWRATLQRRITKWRRNAPSTKPIKNIKM